jgi:hypothetical protein
MRGVWQEAAAGPYLYPRRRRRRRRERERDVVR